MRWPLLLLIIILLSAPALAENNAQIFSEAATNGSHTNAVGNYNLTNKGIWKLQPPINETWHVHRLLIHYEDAGTMDTAAYGNAITLTNGIIIRSNISNTIYNLTYDPVHTNGEWSKHNYDVRHDQYGTGNEFISARWSFDKAGTIIKLDGANGDSIDIILQDDLTGLISQSFVFQGYKSPNTEIEMNNTSFLLIGIVFILLTSLAVFATWMTRHYVYKMISATLLSLSGASLFYFLQEFLEVTNAGLGIINTIEIFYYICVAFFAPLASITFFLLFYYALRVVFFPKKRNDKLW